MRLAPFIRKNKQQILATWDDFARDLTTSPDTMLTVALRDHAAEMLDFITTALESPERRQDMEALLRRAPWESGDSAAKQHGGQRMEWGFSVRDMVAEFRALRISVIRLWSKHHPRMNRDDLVTFDEAIDQALAESIDRFTSKKERRGHLVETMLSFSSDQSAIFDRKGTILYANRALAQAYGSDPHDLEGASVDVLETAFADEVREHIARVWDHAKEVRGDFTVTTKNGEEHVVDYLFAPILGKDNEVEAVALHSRNITERRELERTLWRHANHDHLTGVPNRRLFFDRLEQDILLTRRLGGMLAVLYIDLDKFKDANDRLGHEGGDQLLKNVVQRIQSCTRETDTIARMGGDEFIVILMSVGDREHVESIAGTLLRALDRPFSIEHDVANISGSIGIALYPDDAESTNDLVTRADEAMYVAKDAGGNRCHFYSPDDSRHSRDGRPRVTVVPADKQQ